MVGMERIARRTIMFDVALVLVATIILWSDGWVVIGMLWGGAIGHIVRTAIGRPWSICFEVFGMVLGACCGHFIPMD